MKIKKLTEEQVSKFPEYVNKWVSIGMDTQRANRAQAEKWCREAYKVAGLEKPKFIFWAESPIGLLITAKLVKEIAAKGFKSYSEMNWAQVGAQVVDQVGAQVVDQVRAQVVDQVVDQVEDPVRAQVEDQVRAQVWAQVGQTSLRKEWSELYSWGQHDAGWLSFYDFFRSECGLANETEKLVPLIELSKETGWHLFYKNIAILSEKPIEIHRNSRNQLHNFNGPAMKWSDGYELYEFNGVRC